jgi:dihydroorotate dehydrogenase
LPDWSYHPLFRPLLFRLPAKLARDLALAAMGSLASLPGGKLIIETMGHMAPPENLRRTVWGITFPSPVGLGAGLDIHNLALPALAKFGFGYLELGPVTMDSIAEQKPAERLAEQRAIRYADPLANDGVEQLAARLAQHAPLPIPLGVRLGFKPGSSPVAAAEERCRIAERLDAYCAFFTLDTSWQTSGGEWTITDWEAHLETLRASIAKPLLLVIPPDLSAEKTAELLQPAVARGIEGVVIGGGVAAGDGSRIVGSHLEKSLEMIRWIRSRWAGLPIVGSGGVHQPEDALQMLDAGASLVQIHSGLVYSGPGLPKRINEAIAYYRTEPGSDGRTEAEAARPRKTGFAAFGWLWSALLGIGMVISGAMAWQVAVTSVVLPYDEAFCGISRAEMQQINDRLLPFMSHDRISLAGTMISIGVLYLLLSLFGLRNEMHWARQTLLLSGAAGFFSFFLFIGFGYFDPLHALLSTSLFPLFIMGLRQRANRRGASRPPNLRNDAAWRRALWGQLLFVIIGVGLTAAGLVIAAIGITGVFVPEDLAFLQTTAAELQAANQRLLPLIAHDRAGFGGALVADGLAVLLISLWGFRQGERWIWWTLLLAGLPGFLSGIGIHFAVGYTDFWHLLPAYLAAYLFLLGLLLTYPYLCGNRKENGGAESVGLPL